jgi:hypothetical protein
MVDCVPSGFDGDYPTIPCHVVDVLVDGRVVTHGNSSKDMREKDDLVHFVQR